MHDHGSLANTSSMTVSGSLLHRSESILLLWTLLQLKLQIAQNSSRSLESSEELSGLSINQNRSLDELSGSNLHFSNHN